MSKIIELHDEYFDTSRLGTVPPALYLSSILTMTLWCTVFIIFRILTVTGVRRARAGGRLRVFHHFIAVLMESSAPYSIALILNLVFYIRSDFGMYYYYFDAIAGVAKVHSLPLDPTTHRAPCVGSCTHASYWQSCGRVHTPNRRI